MSENKLNKLYELVIRNRNLKTSILNANGFNSEDIRRFCSLGALEKIKRGEYKFKSVEDLFFYGLNLVNLGDREIGIACLEECLELDSSLLDIYLECFSYSLSVKDYDTAYVFLESFYNYYPSSAKYLLKLNFIKKAPLSLKDEIRLVKTGRKPQEQNKSSNSRNTYVEQYRRAMLLVNSELDRVHEKGIVLLELMDDESRKMIYEIVSNISNVEAMGIGEGDLKRVVLKSSYPQKIDIGQKIREARVAKEKRNNELAIEKNLEILRAFSLTGPLCANLGLLYFRLNDFRTALDYFTIATVISKNEKKVYDFSNLIGIIYNFYSKGEMKPQTSADTEKPQYESYLGISHPMKKIDMVLRGESPETISRTFNLDDDKLTRVYIISARECYKEGNISRGDELLEIAERFLKTIKTAMYLDIVRKNKRLYKSRDASSKVPVVKPVSGNNAN